MKHQRLTHGALSIPRYRWLKAAFIVAAFALLALAVLPRTVAKKAQPQAQSGMSKSQEQAAVKPTPQLKNQAAVKTTPKLQNQAAVKTLPSAENGIRVFKDPVTGELRAPEPGEEQELSQQQSALTGPRRLRVQLQQTPVLMSHISGATGMTLGEDQMSYSMAKKNPDGSLSMDCVSGSQAADKWLKSKPKNPLPVRKEKLDEK
jgi:hypothetical protein